MEYSSIKQKLLNAWAHGQQAESFTNDEDLIAKTILASISTQATESDFIDSVVEHSATFKDTIPDHIKIEFPRPIAVDSTKFSNMKKTAIIKRIKSISGLKVSINNKEQMLSKIKKGVQVSKNFKRDFLLRVTIHLTRDDLMEAYSVDSSSQETEQNEN